MNSTRAAPGPPWPAAPADAGRRTVDIGTLAGIREAVTRYATSAGVADAARQDLVLAVNELATNVIRHGGGVGELLLWAAGGWFYCQVSDSGSGIEDPGRGTGDRTHTDAVAGRGLWLVHRLAENVRIETGEAGTRITLAQAAPAHRSTG